MTATTGLARDLERSDLPESAVRCGVVVVNYGSHALLERNLMALHRVDSELMIVVVDNFTDRAERTTVQRLGTAHGWYVIAESSNRGFGAAVNRGAQRAFEQGAEQVLILNPDASIRRIDLTRLQRRAASDPMTMVAPTVRSPDGKIWFGGAAVDMMTGAVRSTWRSDALRPQEVSWLSGACLLVSRQLWETVGGFDERYFLYWEDVDLSYRVQQAGGALAVLGDATAVHDQGGTQHSRSSSAKSDTYYYQMVRNRLLFAREHLGTWMRARWVLNAPKYAWRVVLHGGRRQLLHSTAPIRAAAKGIRDGAVSPRQRADTRLVVLQSVPQPLPTTNPYNVMLADALDAASDVDLRMFSWREALVHRHDIFHAHWPETLIERRGVLKTTVRRTLFVALLIKWRVSGTAVVRTVHNLELPTGIGLLERRLLLRLEKDTVGRITLNPFTPIEASGPARTVLHGHYRPWFADYVVPTAMPGRIAYFGMVRRYKGVDNLVGAFRASGRSDLSLSIAGKPTSDALAAELTQLAAGDHRIDLRFDFLDTPSLVDHIGRAELIVLPHTGMHNSGSVLAALSLNRPVLVQDNEVNRWLDREVGPGWVHLYRGELSPKSLHRVVDQLRSAERTEVPDLSSRDWSRVAEMHSDVFRESLRIRRGDRGMFTSGSAR